MRLKLTDKQYHALAKRFADAMEKLSIGCVGYWLVQDKTAGIVVAIACFAVSFIITYLEARE